MTGGTETETAQGIDYYRQFFVDPRNPLDPAFVASTEYLAKSLLGKPNNSRLTALDGRFAGFTTELAKRMAASRHFDDRSMGQLHPNGLIPAILAHESSTLRNNNTVAIQSSPAETEMEKEAVYWLIENIARYDSEKARGVLTTGGTLSNLTALLSARDRLVHYKNWDGRSPVTILTANMAHYSVKKAARILGPNGLITVTEIPPDKDGYKMDTEALKNKISQLREEQIPVMAIVASAGQTETGLVDNLKAIATVAEENSIFLHIDGAYGAPFILSKKGELFRGMERGDSLSVDPHKYLYVPYPAGSIMFKNGDDQDFVKALNKEGEDYVLGEFLEDHLGKGRIEGSMGGQGAAAALAAIRTLGTEGLRVVLDHTIDLTDNAYRILCLSNSPFKPAYVPEFNTISFYPKDPNHRTGRWIEDAVLKLEETTGIYISTEILPLPQASVNSPKNVVKSRVFRMVISHPYTTNEIIQEAIGSLGEIWSELVFSNTGQRRIF